MTALEAIALLTKNKPTSDPRKCGVLLCEACDVAVTALEKQVAKEPHLEGDGYADGYMVYDTWICPNCDEHYEMDFEQHMYCPACGQKIKWNE